MFIIHIPLKINKRTTDTKKNTNSMFFVCFYQSSIIKHKSKESNIQIKTTKKL